MTESTRKAQGNSAKVQKEERHVSPDKQDVLDLIKDVQVRLSVTVGHLHLSVRELYALKVGQVMKLEEELNQPLTICLNGKPVASGQLVAVDDHYGIEVVERL